jgi:protein involved in polysaccharide export with SLBB domain
MEYINLQIKEIIKFRYILLLLVCLVSGVVYSQNINETMIKSEIEKRGYDPERFRQEMIKKGINPGSVNPDNPQDVARAQKAAEEVMAILDAEKKTKSATGAGNTTFPSVEVQPQSRIDDIRSVDKPEKIATQSQDIQKAVKDGATIEEAVAEKLQENTKDRLPNATTYGQQIFRDKSLRLFRTTEDAKPTKSYVLGAGDKVAVSIWGPTQENFSMEIQKDGYVQPTNLPRYYLAGLTVKQAEDMMYSTLRKYYYFNRENYELTVSTARTLNVNIVGEVFNSGTFNISAVNTAFNALVAAGGPNNIGSVRKIQLLRKSKKPVTLDVYKYLQDPSVIQDYYLAENDYIYVPVAEKVVEIKGAVNRPFKYELLEQETLEDLIRYAGGLKADALKNNIQIKRIDYDSIRVIDVNWLELERKKQSFTLFNGDEIIINQINTQIKNEVKISGAVENPGTYALADKTKLSDLIKKAKLADNAITDIAYLKRYNDDYKTIRYELVNISEALKNKESGSDIELKKGDELIVSSKATFSDTSSVSVSGSVRLPGTFPLDVNKNLKVSDLIFFAGGLKEDAIDEFAYIFRSKNDGDQSIEYIGFNLKSALANRNSPDNISLMPNDKLVIYSRDYYTEKTFVQLSGAVKKPGEYVYDSSLALKDVLLLAGGLKREAAMDRIDIYRLDFQQNKPSRVLRATLQVDTDLNLVNGGNDFSLQPFDQIVVRTIPEFELQRNVTITGEVKYPGIYALLGKNSRLETVINNAGGVTAEAFLAGATLNRAKDGEGFIIINLDRALKKPGNSHENVILQDGDEIIIPKISNIVSIEGATKAYEIYPDKITAQGKILVPYQNGKSAKFYIDEYAGGLSDNGSKNKITVLDASGKLAKTKHFLFFKIYPKVGPGAKINVGFKPVKTEREKEKEKDDVKWGDILANSIAQATAILSLILLIQNVN